MDHLAAISITLAAAVLLAAASLITSTKARAARQRRRDQAAFTALINARTAAAEAIVRDIHIITHAELQARLPKHHTILQDGWTQP